MLQDIATIYKQLEPLIKRDILLLISKQNNQQQYHFSSIPSHTHNNIDSLPITYGTLKNVQSYLTANTIVITPAQILTLHTTPIVLVKSPGPKSFIFVEGIAGRLTYSGTAYTGTNSLEFRYTNGSGLKVCADMPGGVFLNVAANAYSYSPWQVDYSRNVDSNFTPVGGDTGNNGQVVVSVATANPATGNSSITLTVYYRIVSFST